MYFFQNILEIILNLLFPPKCVGCKTYGSNFCAKCQEDIAFINAPLCHKCGYPHEVWKATCHKCAAYSLTFLDTIRSVAFFEGGSLRKAIHHFKYNNNQMLATDFAGLLTECYMNNQLDSDVIVPVPLHKSRYKERGYNQSELLSSYLSELIERPIDNQTLIRHQKTVSQTTLSSKERKENVMQAFKCKGNALNGKSILLIDDVCTSGSTLEACAEALKLSGVHYVHALTIARAS
ncbi:MAG: hypothetical protein B6242_02035 [Anaerolineaceae bacterium 4572_78]|nr:MAG: hypothetical protein B6242_02035 [Anaerolineaceae bacterium 4572_78]